MWLCAARMTARAPDALRVVNKMPSNSFSLSLIHAILPNARTIHMRRHSFDPFHLFSAFRERDRLHQRPRRSGVPLPSISTNHGTLALDTVRGSGFGCSPVERDERESGASPNARDCTRRIAIDCHGLPKCEVCLRGLSSSSCAISPGAGARKRIALIQRSLVWLTLGTVQKLHRRIARVCGLCDKIPRNSAGLWTVR
jgi:hypothetical protein